MAWVHRHPQHLINQLQIGKNGLGGRCRIQRDPRTQATGRNSCQNLGGPLFGLHMHQNSIRPRVGKSINVCPRMGQHQVHIQWQRSHVARHGNNGRTKTDIRDKVPIHDIQMEGIGTRGLGTADLIPETGDVCGK